MLFQSTLFLFVFLPIVLGGFLAIQRVGRVRVAVAWLVTASALFYAQAQPHFLAVFAGSIAANFAVGLRIQDAGSERARRFWLWLGVVANLAGLAWFKYAHFALETLDQLLALAGAAGGLAPGLERVGLPLAISFFTFQQIAYLVDTAEGSVRERSFLDYALFVGFFPKQVAGPIVHHREMMGQVAALAARRPRALDVAAGGTLFVMGLFKKVVLADAVAGRAGALFDLAHAGVPLTFGEAWTAALGFTFQVYFDFSGYSDMALGLSRCFGITLPLNFHSPYKAADINEFWRRWHITLTRWLRLFLFFPISRGIMRRGGPRWDATAVVVGQLVTMLLCGLWHGAGWTFVLWGGLHGVLLVLHDGWVALKRRLGLAGRLPAPLAHGLGRSLLLATLAATFVVFRAGDLGVAGAILGAMGDLPGAFSSEATQRFAGTVGWPGLAAGALLLAVVWGAPNTQEILADYDPALDLRRFAHEPIPARLRWRPTPGWALFALGCLLPSLYAIFTEGYEEFIYRFF